MPAARGVKKQKSDGVLDEVQRLYRFMQEQGLECLEFSQGDFKVRLTRQRSRALLPTAPGGAVPTVFNAPPIPASPGTLGVPPGAQTVKSPLMGIFYRAPSPSSPPFVKEGDIVKAGQTLCMIEAMKVFNELKAEFDSRILKVLVDNGKPVKVGQELFAIQKNA